MIGLSQFVLPLPVVYMVNCSGTLFVFVLDYFKNGVKVNIKQGIGIVVGFFGVILSTNGDLLMLAIDPEYQQKT